MTTKNRTAKKPPRPAAVLGNRSQSGRREPGEKSATDKLTGTPAERSALLTVYQRITTAGGIVGSVDMRVQANHWLDYDAVALAVLVFGISAVTFFALNL
jgi:hypothetical protein